MIEDGDRCPTAKAKDSCARALTEPRTYSAGGTAMFSRSRARNTSQSQTAPANRHIRTIWHPRRSSPGWWC